MDRDLPRDSPGAGERDFRSQRRARLVVRTLVGFAVAGACWQLARLDMVPSWAFLAQWWPAVVAGLALVAAGVLRARTRQRQSAVGTTVPSSEGGWSRIGGMVTTITAVGALVFTALSLEATREQIEVTQQAQITERYTRAVDQLGAEGPENVHRRLGGIYALERIAVDSARDQTTMVEVLSAFIRSASPRIEGQACPQTQPDVAAAFTVLTRRDISRDPEAMVIDLRRVCLRAVEAVDGNLTAVSLIGADLSEANLSGAYLDLTGLSDATLVGAFLYRADMDNGFVFARNTDFTRANFDSAKLSGAVFSGSTFVGANFEYADLGTADFSGADLTDVTHNDDTTADRAVKDSATVGAWW